LRDFGMADAEQTLRFSDRDQVVWLFVVHLLSYVLLKLNGNPQDRAIYLKLAQNSKLKFRKIERESEG
jgi:hypothetical protein